VKLHQDVACMLECQVVLSSSPNEQTSLVETEDLSKYQA